MAQAVRAGRRSAIVIRHTLRPYLYATLERPLKRHTDSRYYACPTRGCIGQVAPVLEDAHKRPVFVCSQCGRQFSQTTVDQEYRLRRMRDRST